MDSIIGEAKYSSVCSKLALRHNTNIEGGLGQTICVLRSFIIHSDDCITCIFNYDQSSIRKSNTLLYYKTINTYLLYFSMTRDNDDLDIIIISNDC